MKYCSKCGKQLFEGDNFCSGCGARLPMEQIYQNSNNNRSFNKGVSIVIGLFILIMIFSVVFYYVYYRTDPLLKSSNEKCTITLSEFNQIKNGMSYSEIKKIVGCGGTVVSDTEVLDSKMTMYSWYGKDGISNANVTIQDGKCISKAQVGLR